MSLKKIPVLPLPPQRPTKRERIQSLEKRVTDLETRDASARFVGRIVLGVLSGLFSEPEPKRAAKQVPAKSEPAPISPALLLALAPAKPFEHLAPAPCVVLFDSKGEGDDPRCETCGWPRSYHAKGSASDLDPPKVG